MKRSNWLRKCCSLAMSLLLTVGFCTTAFAQSIQPTEKLYTAGVLPEEQLSDAIESAIAENRTNVTEKPRIIVTTDGENDDFCSFIRMLLYVNEYEIEGLVYSSSKHHWAGGTTADGSTVRSNTWHGHKWMDVFINKYEMVYDTLVQHDSEYPTPDSLRSKIRIGNIISSGDMELPTEGSDFIMEVLLDDSNDQEIHLQCWGGTNTFARALLSIEETYSDTPEWDAVYNYVSDKAIIYIIQDQDDTYNNYIKTNWPDIRIYYNIDQFDSFAYRWPKHVPEEIQAYLKSDFMYPIKFELGSPLLEQYLLAGDGHDLRDLSLRGTEFGDPDYPDWGSGNTWYLGDMTTSPMWRWFAGIEQYDLISEGDAPAYLSLLVNNGLRSGEDPTYGGWGGRLELSETVANRWEDGSTKPETPGTVVDYNPYTGKDCTYYPITRWIPAIQNDFAARAEWTVLGYDEANHAPEVAVIGDLDRIVVPGQQVTLQGGGIDPDGDALNLTWWQYQEAGTYSGSVTISGETSNTMSFEVPEDANIGDTIHIIMEVSDDGSPSLTSYQRVILTVSDSVPSDCVLIKIDGDEAIVQGEKAEYTVSAANTSRLATATIWFEVEGNLLTGHSFEGQNGFSPVNDVVWQDNGGGIWTGRITLAHMEGGITGQDFQEIFKMVYSSDGQKTGTAYVKITQLELSGYDANDVAIFNDYEILKDTLVTELVQWFSIYDVNRDGNVDQLDLTTAQLYYRITSEDAEWDEVAQRADVNGDGRVDIEDLILILNHIVW